MTDVKQLPEAFLKEMEQLLGDEYEAYIKSYEEAWKPGLRVNTLKIMPEEFKKSFPPGTDTCRLDGKGILL
mgnify:FL=1